MPQELRLSWAASNQQPAAISDWPCSTSQRQGDSQRVKRRASVFCGGRGSQGAAGEEGERLRRNCLSERDGESESAQPPFPPARSGRAGCWEGERERLSPMASRSTRRFVVEGFLGCVRCDRLIRPRSKRALARQSKTWPQENWQEQGVTSSAPSTAQSPTSDAQRPLPPRNPSCLSRRSSLSSYSCPPRTRLCPPQFGTVQSTTAQPTAVLPI